MTISCHLTLSDDLVLLSDAGDRTPSLSIFITQTLTVAVTLTLIGGDCLAPIDAGDLHRDQRAMEGGPAVWTSRNRKWG